MKLIVCTGPDRKKYKLQQQYGLYYGTRLPMTVVGPLYFADQDWKKPNLSKYAELLARYNPKVATVLDWTVGISFATLDRWVENVAPHVQDAVIIIPKIKGTVKQIPETWYGKKVVLGYSVPTNYGSTEVPFVEFYGRHVHLLGGNIRKQIDLFIAHHKQCIIESIDNNHLLMKANRFGMFWWYSSVYPHISRWDTLRETGIESYLGESNLTAIDLSMYNMVTYWEELLSGFRDPVYRLEKERIDIT